MKNNQLMIGLTIAVIGALAFFGGMRYQQTLTPSRQAGTGQNRTGTNGARGGAFGGNRGGQIIGDVLSSDDKSITVKLPDGSSKIVLISSTTSVVKSTQANISDLAVGTKVGIFGQTNTDGSVTAQNIQLNPINRMQATPSASPTK